MANQIKYGVKFDVDTKSLNQLKSSLQQIKKVSLDDIMKFNNTSLSSAEKILKSIQEDANKVESALNKAFNTKLNTLNLQTFNRELAAAQTSIDKVYQSFSQQVKLYLIISQEKFCIPRLNCNRVVNYQMIWLYLWVILLNGVLLLVFLII